MLHCSPPLPLLSRSSPRRKLLSLLESRYGSKPSCNHPFEVKAASFSRICKEPSITGWFFPKNLSDLGLGARASYSTASLPWIAAHGDSSKDVVVESKAAARVSRSSWEESAEKFFTRNGDDTIAHGNEKIEEEEEEIEPIDNPKWHKIKNKYNRMVKRDERGGRFERPEVRQWNRQENWGRKTWKEAGESTVPKMVGQGVYGVSPVLAALMARRRDFYALYVQEGLDLSGSNKKKDKKGVEKVLQTAEKMGLKVIEASKHDLNMVVDNRPHQGLVLDASPLEMVNTRELEPVTVTTGTKAPVWVALDEVMDPQNLGAIIRSAYFFGAEGVVLCAKNSAPLSGVVSKASAGSLELIELLSCRNMMQFLSSSAENRWRVLGGSVSPKAVPIREVGTSEPTILVLGSEGTGLRPLVERSCTHLVRIPGNIDKIVEGTGAVVEEDDQCRLGHQDIKPFLAVESLNVSVAAGVLLYHLAGSNAHIGLEKSSDSVVIALSLSPPLLWL